MNLDEWLVDQYLEHGRRLSAIAAQLSEMQADFDPPATEPPLPINPLDVPRPVPPKPGPTELPYGAPHGWTPSE